MEPASLGSIFLFCLFASVYIGKLVFLKRNSNIEANVLGRKNGIGEAMKPKSAMRAEVLVKTASFLWIAVWLAEPFFHSQLSGLVGSLFHSTVSDITGLAVLAAGVALFSGAAIQMKTSWRVGIDKGTRTSLVKKGIYKHSRNPAFVGLDLAFAGVFLTFANLLTLSTAVFGMVALHLLILQEEKHLSSVFAKEYSDYAREVPRYLFWF